MKQRESKAIPPGFTVYQSCTYEVSLHTLYFYSTKLWSLSLAHFEITHNKVLCYRHMCSCLLRDCNGIRLQAGVFCEEPHDSSGHIWNLNMKSSTLGPTICCPIACDTWMLKRRSMYKICKTARQLRLDYFYFSGLVFCSNEHQPLKLRDVI